MDIDGSANGKKTKSTLSMMELQNVRESLEHATDVELRKVRPSVLPLEMRKLINVLKTNVVDNAQAVQLVGR
jgi:hypothetical protein